MSSPATIAYIGILYKLSTDSKLSTDCKKEAHLISSWLTVIFYIIPKKGGASTCLARIINIYDLKI
jgi:hypothetical protein